MPRRLIRHALIHLFLCLCFLLPGGLVWNRVEPHVAGLPFSVFVTTVMLPFLIALNLLALLWACWRHDQSFMADPGANIASDSENDRDQ